MRDLPVAKFSYGGAGAATRDDKKERYDKACKGRNSGCDLKTELT